MADEEIHNDDIRKILEQTTPEGKTIGDLSSFSFCQFCLSKMTNISPFDYKIIALTKSLNEWNYDVKMSTDTKIDFLMKLKELGLYGIGQ